MYHPGDVFNVCYIAVMRKLLSDCSCVHWNLY